MDIGWIILWEQPTCRTFFPKFISMAIRKELNSYNNHMDGSDHWHTMYKIKLVILIRSFFLHGGWLCACYVILNSVIYHYLCTGMAWNYILVSFKAFSTDEWPLTSGVSYSINICSWNSLYVTQQLTLANVTHAVLISDRTFASYDCQ
jgi:hypothetical protein